MPFDTIENLPSDNLEISENEKIILNNLYPEETVILHASPAVPPIESSVSSPQEQAIAPLGQNPIAPQKDEISVPNGEILSCEDSPYTSIVIILAIFIFLNHTSVNNWIDRISPDYNIYIKVSILLSSLLILNYFKYL